MTGQELQELRVDMKFSAVLFTSLFFGFICAEPQCERINQTIPDLHEHCGYHLTARFKHDAHFDSAARAIMTIRSRLKNCSAFADVMTCSLFLPRCSEDIQGPYLPCRGVCYDYVNHCSETILREGLEWTAALCEILPEKDNPRTTKGYRERCFTPANYRDSGKRIPGFTKTVVSPHMQQRYQNFINSSINYNASDPQCSRLRKEIVCAENMPACHNGSAWFLCRENCLNFFETCQSPFFYGKNMCMEFPKREGSAPGKFPICKQTHWPRSENWQIPIENPHTLATLATPTVGFFTTKEPDIKSGSTEKPKSNIKTDTTWSPVPGIRGLQKGTKKSASGSNKLLVGLTVSFLLIVLLAAAIAGFVWYRRRENRQFSYQKQVLYNHEKENEIQMYT
ncbi:hypothetical protein P5673_000920 [Acropora cervicornis]|uniref:FZ domain-containing protein n=1 Tax=Acropora cervicornis TaxID=6130 RepID=A0AAD9R596_ACRCE|nr:hypothetical protein P5673_000920 [Acropora cervicornis]